MVKAVVDGEVHHLKVDGARQLVVEVLNEFIVENEFVMQFIYFSSVHRLHKRLKLSLIPFFRERGYLFSPCEIVFTRKIRQLLF